VSFLPEPPFDHASVSRVAVLLVNLGTPEAPTAPAVRRYLRQFLSDPRVVEIPKPLWWIILNGIVLVTRPAASAKKYASIWTPQGSPLKVNTENLTKALAHALPGEASGAPMVVYAMRYGSPSIEEVIDQLRAARAERILVVPLYPQYAASTTASVIDALGAHLSRIRNVPEFRWIRNFHDHPAYIGALAEQIREYWARHGKPDRLLMSFHGLPRFSLDKGDPYHCECHVTARLLAEALSLGQGEWQLSFQSRFGRARWLEPYTSVTLGRWGAEKLRRVDVVCPGFVSDCLETLEEIGMEGKQTFLNAGGGEFHLIPCLNDRASWVTALGEILAPHLAQWHPARPADPPSTKKRAIALGATR
jgi:protoporphyrin/coproporphyrin ferrochelatase